MKPLKFVILISHRSSFISFLVVKVPTVDENVKNNSIYHFSLHFDYSNDVSKTSSENGNGSREGSGLTTTSSSEQRGLAICEGCESPAIKIADTFR